MLHRIKCITGGGYADTLMLLILSTQISLRLMIPVPQGRTPHWSSQRSHLPAHQRLHATMVSYGLCLCFVWIQLCSYRLSWLSFLIVSSSKLIDLDSKPSTRRRFSTYEEEQEPHRFLPEEKVRISYYSFCDHWLLTYKYSLWVLLIRLNFWKGFRNVQGPWFTLLIAYIRVLHTKKVWSCFD
jgi:hypothetical protein